MSDNYSIIEVFTYSEELKMYEARIEMVGREVLVLLEPDDEVLPEEVAQVFQTIYGRQKEFDEAAREFASLSDLVELKNGAWLEEDEAELSSADFYNRITLESITVFTDGSYEFYYNDDDIFWGHVIIVNGSLEDGFTDADMAG